jgi:hypothetical protein
MTVSILMTVSSPRSLRNSLDLEQIVEAHSLGFLAGTRLVLSSSYTIPGTRDVDGIASITSQAGSSSECFQG